MLLKRNAMPANPVKTLLSQDNHSLLMIDHQCLQMLTIRSHNANELINNAVALPTHICSFGTRFPLWSKVGSCGKKFRGE